MNIKDPTSFFRKRNGQISILYKEINSDDDIDVKTYKVFQRINYLRVKLPKSDSIHLIDNLRAIPIGIDLIKRRYICKDLNIAKNTIEIELRHQELNEHIKWFCKKLNCFTEEINHISTLKKQLEKEILLGDLDKALIIIEEIKKEFGTSYWLESSELSIYYFKNDTVSLTKKAIQYNETSDDLSRTFLTYASIKANKSVDYDRYVFSVGKILEEVKQSDNSQHFTETLIFRHMFSPKLELKNLSNIINSDSELTFYDIYENLIKILSYIYSRNIDISECEHLLRKISSEIDDRRFKVLVSNLFGASFSDYDSIDSDYNTAAKLYLTGKYIECASICYSNLISNPTLTCFYELHIKSLNNLDQATREEYRPSGVIGKIFDVSSAIYNSDDINKNITKLKKFHIVLNQFSWSYQLQVTIHKFSGDFSNELKHIYAFIDATCIQENSASPIALINELKNTDATLIPAWRVKKVEGDSHMLNGNYSQSIDSYAEALKSAKGYHSRDISSKYIQALFLDGQIDRAISFIAQKILDGVLGMELPLNDIALHIKKTSRRSADTNLLLAKSILLSEYNKNNSNEFIQCQANICENILCNFNIFTSADLTSPPAHISNFFYKEVFTLDVLSSIPSFVTSPIDVCLTRHNILTYLLNHTTDKVKSEVAKEIRSVMSRIISLKCTSEDGDGKIHIDRESLKNNLIDSVQAELDSIKDIPSKSFDIEYYKDNRHFAGKSNFAYRVIELIELVQNEYEVNKIYGIDQSLNLGIRHGGMINLLWSPLKKYELAADKQDGEFFDPSRAQFCSYQYLRKSDQKTLNRTLAELNQGVDLLIHKYKSRVNVKISDDPEDKSYFNYKIAPDKMIEMVKSPSFYQASTFIDDIFSELDIQTNEIIKNIRQQMLPSIIKEYHSLLDNVNQLNQLNQLKLETLDKAIRLAKIEVTEQVSILKSYFNWRRKSITNYSFNDAVNRAKNIIETINHWAKLDISLSVFIDEKFSDNNFHNWVSIFTLLLENVTRHTENDIKRYSANIKIDNKNDTTVILFTNKVEIITNEIHEKISTINKKINVNFLDEANKDTGSGLYKIKKLLSYYLELNNSMHLRIDGQNFTVKIEYKNEDKSFNS